MFVYQLTPFDSCYYKLKKYIYFLHIMTEISHSGFITTRVRPVEALFHILMYFTNDIISYNYQTCVCSSHSVENEGEDLVFFKFPLYFFAELVEDRAIKHVKNYLKYRRCIKQTIFFHSLKAERSCKSLYYTWETKQSL